MYKVLVSDKLDPKGLEVFKINPGFVVEYRPGIKPDELSSIISNYDALLVRSETKVDKDILTNAKNLKIIGRAGAGVDNVDLTESTRRGIIVANVPGGNTIAAMEHTFALILALARNVPEAVISLKKGEWNRTKFVGIELYGKTLSIIGFGKIGQELGYRALAFGMKVVAYDPYISPDYIRQNNIIPVSFEEAIQQADFLSIHVPKTAQTKNMINLNVMNKMKKGVCIINCARGGIVNEQDLIVALSTGQVRKAALDVFETEPLPVDSPLLKVGTSLILTPHLGASTEEAQEKVSAEISRTVIEYFTRGTISNAINIASLDPRDKLEPYLYLVEKIGLFVSQIITGGITQVKVEYAGEIAQYNITPLTTAVLKGILSHILETGEVNLVNANFLAKERGINVIESKSRQAHDFANLITVTTTSVQEEVNVAGTILSQNLHRIVRVNNLNIDIVPEGNLLVLKNNDQPGVIGFIGTLLGNNNVNIASMDVARRSVGGEAITIVNVDTPVREEILTKLQEYTGITTAKTVVL